MLEISFDDLLFVLGLVVGKVKRIDKSVFERCRERLTLRGCADEGKWLDGDPYVASLGHHHIDHKVFHRDIQDFLQCRSQPMDLIDKQNVSGVECMKDGDHLGRLGDGIARDDFDIDSHILCDDLCECCLTVSARAREQYVSQCMSIG